MEDKGKVIRRLMEIEDPEMKIETIEGVKLHHNKGCVLVLPDAENPSVKFMVRDIQKNLQRASQNN